jgi:hypothetical protein
MLLTEMGSGTANLKQCQRIDVVCDGVRHHATITLERFDNALGWYPAGTLTLPLCQIPLLQQALEEMSAAPICSACPADAYGQKVIPFPLLVSQPSLLEETGSAG